MSCTRAGLYTVASRAGQLAEAAAGRSAGATRTPGCRDRSAEVGDARRSPSLRGNDAERSDGSKSSLELGTRGRALSRPCGCRTASLTIVLAVNGGIFNRGQRADGRWPRFRSGRSTRPGRALPARNHHLPTTCSTRLRASWGPGPTMATANRSGPLLPAVTATIESSSMSVSSITRVAARRSASISRMVGRSDTRRFGPRISYRAIWNSASTHPPRTQPPRRWP